MWSLWLILPERREQAIERLAQLGIRNQAIGYQVFPKGLISSLQTRLPYYHSLPNHPIPDTWSPMEIYESFRRVRSGVERTVFCPNCLD